MKLRHILIISFFILINGLIVFSLKKGFSKPIEVKIDKKIIPSLKGVTVKNNTETFSINGFGNVSSFNSVNLTSEVQGKLVKGNIQLKSGSKFKKGDLLYAINSTESRYNLRGRKSSYINLIASILPDIKSDYSSEFDKWNSYLSSITLNNSIPQLPSWQSTKEKVFLSSKKILTEYFAIKAQEEQLKKFTVYAPFSGTISQVYTNIHSVVNPGSKVIKISQNSNFEIAVSIPKSQIESLQIGTKAKIHTTTGILKGQGEIVRFSDVINKNTQSVDVFLKAKPLDDVKFIDGEYVKIEIASKGSYSGIRIPSLAINDNSVFVYSKKDSLIKRKTISILDENNAGVFITGLSDNDIVITQEILNSADSVKYNMILK